LGGSQGRFWPEITEIRERHHTRRPGGEGRGRYVVARRECPEPHATAPASAGATGGCGVTRESGRAKPVFMSDSRETGPVLDPKYDAAGLITAVATDRTSGDVLMLAHMNAEALAATVATGEAHFWSRSRGKLWKKGETSGHILRVADIATQLLLSPHRG